MIGQDQFLGKQNLLNSHIMILQIFIVIEIFVYSMLRKSVKRIITQLEFNSICGKMFFIQIVLQFPIFHITPNNAFS